MPTFQIIKVNYTVALVPLQFKPALPMNVGTETKAIQLKIFTKIC